jgi:hypothetical protein
MSSLEKALPSLFRLDEEGWLRHANPWSVATRTLTYPFLAAAIWARLWLGWWSLALVALALLYAWLNPRLFAPPRSTKNWASFAVFGERVWLQRETYEVAQHHRTLPKLLNGLNAAASVLLAYGLWQLELWPTVMAICLSIAFKFWFLDRMVWIFRDHLPGSEDLQAWVY